MLQAGLDNGLAGFLPGLGGEDRLQLPGFAQAPPSIERQNRSCISRRPAYPSRHRNSTASGRPRTGEKVHHCCRCIWYGLPHGSHRLHRQGKERPGAALLWRQRPEPGCSGRGGGGAPVFQGIYHSGGADTAGYDAGSTEKHIHRLILPIPLKCGKIPPPAFRGGCRQSPGRGERN